MIINTYNPYDAQAGCPVCCKLVPVYLHNANLAFAPRYMEFEHQKCGTRWKAYLDSGRVEILENSDAT